MANRQAPKYRRWRPSDIEDGQYTTSEVAHYTGRATATVVEWCSDGKLPGVVRVGVRYRIPAEVVRRILRDGSPPWEPAGAVAPFAAPNGAPVKAPGAGK